MNQPESRRKEPEQQADDAKNGGAEAGEIHPTAVASSGRWAPSFWATSALAAMENPATMKPSDSIAIRLVCRHLRARGVPQTEDHEGGVKGNLLAESRNDSRTTGDRLDRWTVERNSLTARIA